MVTFILISHLLGCSSPPPAQPAAAPPTAVVAPAPAPAAVVGPDGPATIDVPNVAAISTGADDIKAGEKVFTARGCPACHKFGEKLVGPDLNGVTTRRTPMWIERQFMFPELMTKQDPVSKGLLGTYMVQMPTQGVTTDEAPKLLAYIKSQEK